MCIRRAREGEHQRLTDISFESKGYWKYPAEYFDIWRDELTITIDYIQNNLVYVYENRDVILGYYSVVYLLEEIECSGVTIEKGFWLEHMFVLPGCIGKGIGACMVSHLWKVCKELQIQEICVLADPNAKMFYEKMGLRYVQEVPSTIGGRTTPLLKKKIDLFNTKPSL